MRSRARFPHCASCKPRALPGPPRERASTYLGPESPLIRFYFHPTPNPAKVALLLEELGLPYEVVPVDTAKGEQHAPAFRAINPNGKVPAIVDTEGPGGKEARVFDSSAILLYLGEKTGRFVGAPADRPELLSWLFFIATRRRPLLRSGGAFPARGAGKASLCGQPLPARDRAPLSRPRPASGRPRLHRRHRLFDRRHVRLGLAGAGRQGAARRGRSARRLPESQAPVRDRRRAAGGGAGESGRRRIIRSSERSDEETKRAMFPSNYPEIASLRILITRGRTPDRRRTRSGRPICAPPRAGAAFRTVQAMTGAPVSSFTRNGILCGRSSTFHDRKSGRARS